VYGLGPNPKPLKAYQQDPAIGPLLWRRGSCEDYCERELDELELQAAGSTCTSAPDTTSRPSDSGRPVADVDPEQDAALRRLRAAFGFVEVLRVIGH
jgi:hypothetical protein